MNPSRGFAIRLTFNQANLHKAVLACFEQRLFGIDISES
jgi:hypothetical protein